MNIPKIGIIVAICLVLISCSDNRDDTWLVGTSPDNPPYEYMKNGQVAGFDIDLMKAIGQHLGKKIEFKTMEFQGLLAALSSKNVDMVIAGLSVTPQRQARVDFSVPYSNARIAMLVDKKHHIIKADDLKPNMVVGAQLGTIWSLIAHDMSVVHGFRIKSLASNLILVEELKAKRIDAVILEESQAEQFATKNPGLSNFSVKEYGSSFAIALPKNSPIKKNIDYTIKSLKNNGTIDALNKKWGIISAN
jgi:polar amino acid transport system substrate-binding protein